jgi:hypothetical protein
MARPSVCRWEFQQVEKEYIGETLSEIPAKVGLKFAEIFLKWPSPLTPTLSPDGGEGEIRKEKCVGG